MGVVIFAKEACEVARQVREKNREAAILKIAEEKFQSVFTAIYLNMMNGETYIQRVAIRAGDIEDFKMVMQYYGYIVQCQSGHCRVPDGNWTAEYSIWFNK